MSFDYKAKRFARAAHLPPLERHHGWKEIFSPDARAELLDGRRGAVDPLDLYRARYAETEGADELARLQDVDIGIYLVDDLLVKTDRASMAHSLEARVPFCDPVVAELALALPRRMKVRGLSKKRLLRQAVATLLPQRDRARAASRGSRSRPRRGCAATWSRSPATMLSPERLRAQGFFDPAAVTGAARRPCRAPRGPQPPDLGPADVLALARALRDAVRRIGSGSTQATPANCELTCRTSSTHFSPSSWPWSWSGSRRRS